MYYMALMRCYSSDATGTVATAQVGARRDPLRASRRVALRTLRLGLFPSRVEEKQECVSSSQLGTPGALIRLVGLTRPSVAYPPCCSACSQGRTRCAAEATGTVVCPGLALMGVPCPPYLIRLTSGPLKGGRANKATRQVPGP